MDNICLVIDDDVTFGRLLAKGLTRLGLEAYSSESIEEANALLSQYKITHVTLDLNLGSDNGLLFIPTIRERYPDCIILILTGYASIATAVKAVKLGASAYLPKPVVADDVFDSFFSKDEECESLSHQSDLSTKEWEHIQSVLESVNYNITKAAEQLGMHRRTLQRKLQKRQYFN